MAMVCNMQRDPVLELKYCRQLWEHRVSGLILAGGGFDQVTHHDKLVAVLDQMMSNGVVVTPLSPRDLDAPVFSVDNGLVGEWRPPNCSSMATGVWASRSGASKTRPKEEPRGMTEAFEAAGVRYISPNRRGRQPETAVSDSLAKNRDHHRNCFHART